VIEGGGTEEDLPLPEKLERFLHTAERRRGIHIVTQSEKSVSAPLAADDQGGPVTRGEFNAFREEMRQRFDALEQRLPAPSVQPLPTIVHAEGPAEPIRPAAAPSLPQPDSGTVRRVRRRLGRLVAFVRLVHSLRLWQWSLGGFVPAFVVFGVVSQAWFFKIWQTEFWTSVCAMSLIISIALACGRWDYVRSNELYQRSASWPQDRDVVQRLLHNAVGLHQTELTTFWARFTAMLYANLMLSSLIALWLNFGDGVGALRIMLSGGYALSVVWLAMSASSHRRLHVGPASALQFERILGSGPAGPYHVLKIARRIGLGINVVAYILPTMFAIGYCLLWNLPPKFEVAQVASVEVRLVP